MALDGTKILPCVCSSKFMDETYGPQKRVFNLGSKDKKATKWICANCLRTLPLSSKDEEEIKAKAKKGVAAVVAAGVAKVNKDKKQNRKGKSGLKKKKAAESKPSGGGTKS
jgi:hypothetical protein